MSEKTNIEWCDHTFNHVRGCTKVSEGCKFCYADGMSGRNPKTLGVWGPKGTRAIAAESYWKLPVKWNKEAKEAGERRRVFCASLADVFEGLDTMPADAYNAVDEARARLFRLIEQTPDLDWLLLTKRPQNIMALCPDEWVAQFPANVWVGTSVEDQTTADERIPHLLKVPAVVRFLSCEPLLGPLDLFAWLRRVWKQEACSEHSEAFNLECPACNAMPRVLLAPPIGWIICGGESGRFARPMHPAWARRLRLEAAAAGIPFLFKQWGEWMPTDAVPGGDLGGDLAADRVRHIRAVGALDGHFRNGDAYVRRVGKKVAGRVLDGRLHDEYPQVCRP
jgi:protein gp37